MNLALLTTALLVGCLLAVQASVNLQLNKAVGTPYGASTLQLGVATALLVLLAVAVGAFGAVGLALNAPIWQLLGGLASPLYITSGILLFSRLGALAAVGLFVTGQMLASLGLDLFGLLGVPLRPLSIGIVSGAVAVLGGITLIIRGQQPASERNRSAPTAVVPVRTVHRVGATAAPARSVARVGRTGWILLGVIAGAGLPIQGAVNARLRAGLGEPLAVALISFTVATVTIGAVLVVLLTLRATPLPSVRRLAYVPWWGWLGGACAAAYVTATFMLIPVIGAATTVTLTVTGQQVASAVIDSRGLFHLPRRALSPSRMAGVVLLVAGSAIVQLS